ncbi:hypothetical protein J3R83DRAFT_592 [Lanmaoa asiatica]|nr:hypothetical protein J3R83DRAFT_592 [Lanmaoa asiatica]
MPAPASRTVPSSPNPSAQGSPRSRDWSNLRTGDPGSAFRGMSRGRGSRGGGVRGGRGGGHPPNNSGHKGGSHSDTAKSTPSPSPKVPSVSRKPPAPTSTTATPNGVSEKAVNGSTERGGRPKPGSRKQSRAVPTVVVAPAAPSETSQTAPPTPSRSGNRQRRAQSGKGPTTTTKPLPLPNVIKTQKSRGGFTPASQTVIRKDVPPHLVAAHEAEIRHDIDALVERVRAVAMAENRPTTPGSHIDWAGDEDDSLPDLDDWGVTTHTNVTRDEDQSEEISPILEDTLKPLPEPNSEVHRENEREMETYDAQPKRIKESPIQPSFLPSPTERAVIVPSAAQKAPEQCIIVPTAVETSPNFPDGKFPLHPSLPPKPVAAMESLRARGRSISKSSNLPPKPPVFVADEEALTTKTEGLSESIHAPSADEQLISERVSSASSSERGLAASIHAPVSGLPESHSAPSLLSGHPSSATPHTHSRSQTEGRPGVHQPHTAPPGIASHRHGRSGASSPLGKHVYTHSRNHSTPAGGAGPRPPQASRPVISGEAISRLARTIGGGPRPPQASRPAISGEAISRLASTIGGIGPPPRTQTIPVTKDSTISS